MKIYQLDGFQVDSIELKCLLVSKGVRVDKAVYRRFTKQYRLGLNPLMCNCFFLSDGTVVQMTDLSFHLQYLTGILSWDNLKLLKYAADLKSPFSVQLVDDSPAIFYGKEYVDCVTFPPKTDFFLQKTSSGLAYLGNAVIQGIDWVAFQCLWACEYAAAGKPCQFCFSGADFETCARKKITLPAPVTAADVAEIVAYAVDNVGCNSIQITGGSTFHSAKEASYIVSYLQAINQRVGREKLHGEVLLYLTPPEDLQWVDAYFHLGASRIGCSLEVWDLDRAKVITPGKIQFSTRQRHLAVLEYVAERYGAGKGFSNFIIGIEPFESLKVGATYLAERGILPTASIWMPMGRPVMDSMQTPDVVYYRKVKELFAELYQKYHLEPPAGQGLNVCMERDIWNYAMGAAG